MKVYTQSAALIPYPWVKAAKAAGDDDAWHHSQGDLLVVAATKDDAGALLAERGSWSTTGLRVSPRTSPSTSVAALRAAGVVTGEEPGVWFWRSAQHGNRVWRVDGYDGRAVRLTEVGRWRYDRDAGLLLLDVVTAGRES